MKPSIIASSVLALGLISVSAAALAKDDEPNKCNELSVQISNKTGEICELITSPYQKHGRIKSGTQPAQMIPNGGTSVPFLMDRISGSVYGPDVVLEYECGNGKRVTIESQQKWCYFKAGDIHGTTLNRQNMHAHYRANQGSWLWDTHGTISWTLEN